MYSVKTCHALIWVLLGYSRKRFSCLFGRFTITVYIWIVSSVLFLLNWLGLDAHCKYIQCNFYAFYGCPISTVIPPLFGCSIDATQQQMELNFELVVGNQLLSVIKSLTTNSKFKPSVAQRDQCDIRIVTRLSSFLTCRRP